VGAEGPLTEALTWYEPAAPATTLALRDSPTPLDVFLKTTTEGEIWHSPEGEVALRVTIRSSAGGASRYTRRAETAAAPVNRLPTPMDAYTVLQQSVSTLAECRSALEMGSSAPKKDSEAQ